MSESLAHSLRQYDDLEVTGIAQSIAEARQQILSAAVDVLILDALLPNGCALAFARWVLALPTPAHVLVVSDNAAAAQSMLQLGVQGYMLKAEPIEAMVAALRAIVAGGVYMSANVAQELAYRAAPQHMQPQIEELNEQELVLLRLLAEGKSNLEMGALLAISDRTVRYRLRSLCDKLGLPGRDAAIAWAGQHGLGKRD